jgi:hypothetical protein
VAVEADGPGHGGRAVCRRWAREEEEGEDVAAMCVPRAKRTHAVPCVSRVPFL